MRFSFDESIPGKPALRLDIIYAAPAFEKDLPLNLDLSSVPGLDALGSLVDVNSTGNLKVKAGADVTLSIGIDVTDPARPQPFLYTDDARIVLGGTQAISSVTGQTITLPTGTSMATFTAGDYLKLPGATGGLTDTDKKSDLFKIGSVAVASRQLTLIQQPSGANSSTKWTLKRKGLVLVAGAGSSDTIASSAGALVTFPATTNMSVFSSGAFLVIEGASGGTKESATGAANLFRILSVNAANKTVTLHSSPALANGNPTPAWSLKEEVGTVYV